MKCGLPGYGIDHCRKANSYKLKQSHAIVVTSAREGWGIVVTEANALYTPAIGYNIAGIRDSIINGQTGLLTKKNNPQLLSEAIVTLLSDKTLYFKMRQNALNKAKEFSWDRSAKETLAVLNKAVCSERI